MKMKVLSIFVCMLLIASVLPAIGTCIDNEAELYIEVDEEMSNARSDVDWWPMFCHGLSRRGYSNSTTPDTNDISWSFQTGGQIESKPVVMDGRVYVGSDDFNMYCLDAETGEIIWTFSTDSPIRSGAAVYEAKVYFGSYDFNVYCVDAVGNGDGTTTLIWSYETDVAEYGIYSSPAVFNGRVFIGGQDGKVYCLDAEGNGDGTTDLIWNYSFDRVTASPAIYNGKVYIGSVDGNISCLDAEGNGDGTTDLIWSYETGPSELGVLSSPAVADDKIYVGSNDGKVYCLDAEGNGDGTTDLIWSHFIGIPGYCSPAIAYKKIYIRSYQDGVMYCLDALGNGDGTTNEIWRYTTGPSILGSTSPGVADEKVYIGSGDRKVYCLDALGNGDGTTDLIWSYETSSAQHGVLSSPAIADGKVYIGAFDGKLYVFGAFAELEIVSFISGISITFEVKNVGNADATDVEWESIIVDGFFIYPRNASDTIGTIEANESKEIKIPVFGIGLGVLKDIPQIGVMISAYNAETVYKMEIAKIIGPFVILQEQQ